MATTAVALFIESLLLERVWAINRMSWQVHADESTLTIPFSEKRRSEGRNVLNQLSLTNKILDYLIFFRSTTNRPMYERNGVDVSHWNGGIWTQIYEWDEVSGPWRQCHKKIIGEKEERHSRCEVIRIFIGVRMTVWQARRIRFSVFLAPFYPCKLIAGRMHPRESG